METGLGMGEVTGKEGENWVVGDEGKISSPSLFASPLPSYSILKYSTSSWVTTGYDLNYLRQ
jgi:hypothetical protein